MHVYVILAEEHKLIFFIFNHHQQVDEALVFQMPVLHKHVQRYRQPIDTPNNLKSLSRTKYIMTYKKINRISVHADGECYSQPAKLKAVISNLYLTF